MLDPGAREAVTQIIRALPERLQSALLFDLSQAEVEDRNGIGSMLGFRLPAHEVEDERGKLLPIEGKVGDADGAPIDVMLWVDGHDRLYELELVRYHPGNLIGPNWATFRLRS